MKKIVIGILILLLMPGVSAEDRMGHVFVTVRCHHNLFSDDMILTSFTENDATTVHLTPDGKYDAGLAPGEYVLILLDGNAGKREYAYFTITEGQSAYVSFIGHAVTFEYDEKTPAPTPTPVPTVTPTPEPTPYVYHPATALFFADPTEYCAPANVAFWDWSMEFPINWDWYVNGVKFSDISQAVLEGLGEGVYSIDLWVNNEIGGSWMNRTNYITVSNCTPPPVCYEKEVCTPGYFGKIVGCPVWHPPECHFIRICDNVIVG